MPPSIQIVHYMSLTDYSMTMMFESMKLQGNGKTYDSLKH